MKTWSGTPVDPCLLSGFSGLSRVSVNDSFGSSSWTLLQSPETCLKGGKSSHTKHGIRVSRNWRTFAVNPSSIYQTEFLKTLTVFCSSLLHMSDVMIQIQFIFH
jgi:hypothetical protein